MDPASIVLIILGAAAILFFTELVPLPVTAMLVPISLNLAGVIPADEAFKNFGNKWVVLFMGMFVVGEGIFRTGLADRVGKIVIHTAGASKARLVVMTMLAVGIMSGFLSNTGTVAVFIPLVVGVAASAKLKAGLLLMPMAFAASLGGTITVIGTPPNGVVNSAMENAITSGQLAAGGSRSFGFFEFGKIGLIFLAAGILYYAVIGHRFLTQSEGDSVEQHRGSITYRTDKRWQGLGVFVLVILVMGLTALKQTDPEKFALLPGIPLQTAAMLGACLMVITRCVTMKEAFNSISWTTIFLFAGMLSMSTAMRTSGAAELVADFVVTRISHPHVLLAAVFGITAIVTNFMSNTATATLMGPLGIAMAVKMGVNPAPILMGVAMAASCCFLTPIATPPNTMVLGPGGYKFRDYIKAGWPLQVISFILGVALIPLLWPF